MTRVKRGTISNKSRKNILKRVKGYRFGRSKKERQANEAIFHAGSYAFAHRRDKKGDFRRIWNVRINAVLEKYEMPYSKFMGALKKKGIVINRKMLADLGANHPEIFKKIFEQTR